MADSPIFIVGCPRSGTTLLRDLLRAHPRLTFPGESQLLVDLYKGYGDPQNEREAVRLAAKMLNMGSVPFWGLRLEPSSFANDRSYRAVASRLYEAWALSENKPRWGDKTPRYVTDIPVLPKIFPDAKVIHIYRDGRDVALSWLSHQFGPHNLFTAARNWKLMVSSGREAGARLPQNTYLEVRYELLITSPAETMKRVCAFLDEPFTEAVLRPNPWGRRDTPRRYRPIVGSHRRAMRSTEIVSGNAGKWKQAMSASERNLFESVAGDLLAELGYETEGVSRRITKPEMCVWKGHNFLMWFLRRLNMTGSPRLLREGLIRKWSRVRHRRRSREER
jgi:hypothetical protein